MIIIFSRPGQIYPFFNAEIKMASSPSSASLKDEFPIHWLVWHNNYRELDTELEKNVVSRICLYLSRFIKLLSRYNRFFFPCDIMILYVLEKLNYFIIIK